MKKDNHENEKTESSQKSLETKKDNLRVYVSKLNDRNLQRKRESGITTYALYAVLILIILKIIDQYPLFPIRTHLWDILYLSSATFYLLYFLYAAFLIANNKNENTYPIKLLVLNKKKNGIDFFKNFWLYSSSVVEILLSVPYTVHFVMNNNIMLADKLIIFPLSLMMTQNFVIIKLSIENYRKKKNKVSKYIFKGEKGDDKTPIYLAFLGLIAFVSLFLASIFNYNTNINKLNIIVFASLIYSLFIVLDKIFEYNKSDNFFKDMEHLEYEINVLDLNNDQIKAKLQRNFMGYFLNEFINDDLKESEDFVSKTTNKIFVLNHLKEHYNKVDPIENPFEYKGRKEVAETAEADITKSIDNFFYEKTSEIRNIIENSNLSPQETDSLSNYLDKLNVIQSDLRHNVNKT